MLDLSRTGNVGLDQWGGVVEAGDASFHGSWARIFRTENVGKVEKNGDLLEAGLVILTDQDQCFLRVLGLAVRS